MREICASLVCVDLPGRGPFCYRLVECLAVGSCVVAPRHATVLHAPLEDGQHIAFAREDLEDLAEISHRYAVDEVARLRVQAGAMQYFDRYLRPTQLAGYYLHECLRVVGRR